MKNKNFVRVISYLILIFLPFMIYSRKIDKSKEGTLSKYIPKFHQSEVNPTETTCYITLETIPWYPNSISYTVYISEINDREWNNDKYIFKNWDNTDQDIISYTQNHDNLWNPWELKYQGTKRIIYLTKLSSGSYYRVKYQINSKFSTSLFSEIKFISLKRNNMKVNLYMKGTGRNNHANALIKINNQIILEHGKFQGLAAVVLNRRNLRVESIKIFDTYNKNENIITKNVTFTKYSYDENGNIITTSETIEKAHSLLLDNDQQLQRLLKSLTEIHLLLIVSCYGWEKYFTYKTAEILSTFGALKLKELSHAFYEGVSEDKFKYDSILPKNIYHHPYAFVGIRHIGSGNGYEVVQTNKGNYISTKNLPQAEIIVTLIFNEFNRAYYFDINQKYKSSYNLINYPFLHKSDDLSLKNLFSLLLYANITSAHNSHFDIYDWNTASEHLIPFDSNNDNINGIYQTELDRVVLGSGIGSIRSYFKGGIYQNGKNVYELDYYPLYLQTGIKGIECLPPYTPNGKECIDPNVVDNYAYEIPIITCGIGLAPQICKDNKDFSNHSFQGFN